MALATSTNGSVSGQANTQNPQTAGQSSIGSAKTSGVQPGTASSLLTSQQGIALQQTPLSTVTINPSTPTATTSTATTAPAAPKHHINPVLLAFPVILVLAAIILFWTAKRSVKSTTD